jgi:hypothetical protein
MTNIGARLPELYTVYSQDIPPKFPLPNSLIGFPIARDFTFHALMTWRVEKATENSIVAKYVSLGSGSETGSDLFDIKKVYN